MVRLPSVPTHIATYVHKVIFKDKNFVGASKTTKSIKILVFASLGLYNNISSIIVYKIL